nr:rhodanese-like domain-containing protein 6 [Ipomoea batatas]
MGSLANNVVSNNPRKPRFLCLHGFRTSAEILKKQVVGKWNPAVVEKLDLVFVDAPFPCQGKSDVEGLFDPPYYEWFQFNKDFTEYENFDECLEYIEDYMIKHGPFDGLLGFSQVSLVPAILMGVFVIGKEDFLREPGLQLIESCVDPLVIHHPKGHTIPRFDEKGLEDMLSFVERIQKEINMAEEQIEEQIVS